jgi:hypothetical protein
VAENTLGYNVNKVRNGWYDEECKEVLEVQMCARFNMLQRETRGSIQIYKDARKEARKVCRRKKTLRRRTTLEENNYFGPECNIEVPTLKEILGIIRNMKNNRARGEDSITAELIKYGGRKLRIRIYQLKKEYGRQNRCPRSGAQP